VRSAQGSVAAIAAISAGLAACTQRSGNLMEIEGYSIPWVQVDAYVPPEKGGVYLRLKPEVGVWLILDRVADRKQAEQDRMVIPGINDGFNRKVDFVQTGVGTVLCKQTPRYSCGFQIGSDGRNWNVIFDRRRLPEVGAIRSRAVHVIQSYRKQA
jgi:hypothetical protein